MVDQVAALLEGLPTVLIYVVLALGAALENVVPIIPADTVIVMGGLVAGVGRVDPGGVFVATWAANVIGAALVYGLGLRFGLTFFNEGPGRHLLSPGQMQRLGRFYDRWGIPAIFLARFLPGFRALVPVFAGVTRQRPLRVLPPLVLASALWYGGLVRLGFVTGQNLESVVATLARANRWLLVVSFVLVVVMLLVWTRTRREPEDPTSGPTEETVG
ncbi:MAG: DedA family protein [Gemmatimonadetes bacterium]|nr:DedA family protein [Gemmatimonadota bacterium]